MRFLLFLLLFCVAPASFASGGYEGFLYVMAGQALLMLWPLSLPLFFLAGVPKKGFAFLAGLFCTYGALGLTGIPWGWYTQVMIWSNTPPDFAGRDIWSRLATQHVIAIFIAVLALRKVRQFFVRVEPNNGT